MVICHHLEPLSGGMNQIKEKSDVPIKEACVLEALRIASEMGLDSLSLREVARRLGVSHQAPYKHYSSREHLLAVLVERCLDEFLLALINRPRSQDPGDDLAFLGEAYLEFAQDRSLVLRIIFESNLTDNPNWPILKQKTTKVFKELLDAVRSIRPDLGDVALEQAALFAWSTVHGLAMIRVHNAHQSLGANVGLNDQETNRALLQRICSGLAQS